MVYLCSISVKNDYINNYMKNISNDLSDVYKLANKPFNKLVICTKSLIMMFYPLYNWS